MKLAKEKVVEFIRARGDDRNAERAEKELPETLELPGDEGTVAQYGVTPDDLDDSSVWGT